MDIKTCTWLLEDVIEVEAEERVALCFADDPKFAYFLAQSVGHVDVFDLYQSRLDKLRADIAEKTPNLSVHETVFPAQANHYDTIMMLAQKGRDFDQAMIQAAFATLKPEGTLYIAGSTKEGAKTVIADAGNYFGNSSTLIYKRSHRVGVSYAFADHTPPSLDALDWNAPTAPVHLSYDTPYGDLPGVGMPGVFSWESLDKGTAFLLETLELEDLSGTETVLDMGCGVGVIGALAAGFAGKVTLVDDNLLAVHCARETLARNEIANAEVRVSDVFSALEGRTFDLILCNPPFHREFDVNTNVAHRVIRESVDHLNPGGRLVIVANAFLNYERVAREHFRTVRIVAEANRFKVIECGR